MESADNMKSSLSLLPAFLIGIAALVSLAPNANADYLHTMDIGVHAGYRVDKLDWNIAGNAAGRDPNILSELNWKDLKIWQVGGSAKIAVANDIVDYRTYIRASLDYGWITDGTVRDSDYHQDNRTLEIFRSFSDTNDDNVLDSSIGLGFERDYWQNRVTLGWLGGYSYHEQNLRLTNSMQYIPVQEPVRGLNSTYKTKWWGPFAGIDLAIRPSPRFTLFGSAEYHWADYRAQANWNLRADFSHPLSFQHDANKADGLVGTIKGSYAFSRGWTLDLSFDYHDFTARDGRDRAFMADGTTTAVKLNEVNWTSYATTLGVTYNF